MTDEAQHSPSGGTGLCHPPSLCRDRRTHSPDTHTAVWKREEREGTALQIPHADHLALSLQMSLAHLSRFLFFPCLFFSSKIKDGARQGRTAEEFHSTVTSLASELSYQRVSLQVQGLFATFWSHLQTKDRQSQTLHLHWTLKKIKVERAPQFYRRVCPKPQHHLQPRHTHGPFQLPQAGTVRSSCPLGSPAILCADTAAALAGSSSISYLTAGSCSGSAWGSRDALNRNVALPCSQSMAQLPDSCIPQWYLQAQEGHRDPSSAQTSWAESPAHHTKTSQIHNVWNYLCSACWGEESPQAKSGKTKLQVRLSSNILCSWKNSLEKMFI